MSLSVTPNSGTTSTAGVPGSNATGSLRIPVKRRALTLDPRPSGLRANTQWTTVTPAARAAAVRRAPFGMTVSRAAAASSR